MLDLVFIIEEKNTNYSLEPTANTVKKLDWGSFIDRFSWNTHTAL